MDNLYGSLLALLCSPGCRFILVLLYERDFIMSLSVDKQTDIIDTFNTTFRYLDDNLNIDNIHFDNMVSQIYPS